MNLTEQETAVLDYYRRENKGVIESEALAGLSLNTLRAARARLVAKGALVVTAQGRYVPVGAVTG
jgi:predicted transcriptional regulator of viral defense system